MVQPQEDENNSAISLESDISMVVLKAWKSSDNHSKIVSSSKNYITETFCLYACLYIFFFESPVCTLFIVVEEDDSEWHVVLLCNL